MNPEDAAPVELAECNICNRKFAKDRIPVHQKICAKSAKKVRVKFDPTESRLAGTDAEKFFNKETVAAAPPKPKSNWKKKHEDLMNTVRAARVVKAHLEAGGKISDLPPPPPLDTSDLIPCQHCGRKFNKAAAERHIPKCADMIHNKPKAKAATTKPIVVRKRRVLVKAKKPDDSTPSENTESRPTEITKQQDEEVPFSPPLREKTFDVSEVSSPPASKLVHDAPAFSKGKAKAVAPKATPTERSVRRPAETKAVRIPPASPERKPVAKKATVTRTAKSETRPAETGVADKERSKSVARATRIPLRIPPEKYTPKPPPPPTRIPMPLKSGKKVTAPPDKKNDVDPVSQGHRARKCTETVAEKHVPRKAAIDQPKPSLKSADSYRVPLKKHPQPVGKKSATLTPAVSAEDLPVYTEHEKKSKRRVTSAPVQVYPQPDPRHVVKEQPKPKPGSKMVSYASQQGQKPPTGPQRNIRAFSLDRTMIKEEEDVKPEKVIPIKVSQPTTRIPSPLRQDRLPLQKPMDKGRSKSMQKGVPASLPRGMAKPVVRKEEPVVQIYTATKAAGLRKDQMETAPPKSERVKKTAAPAAKEYRTVMQVSASVPTARYPVEKPTVKTYQPKPAPKPIQQVQTRKPPVAATKPELPRVQVSASYPADKRRFSAEKEKPQPKKTAAATSKQEKPRLQRTAFSPTFQRPTHDYTATYDTKGKAATPKAPAAVREPTETVAVERQTRKSEAQGTSHSKKQVKKTKPARVATDEQMVPVDLVKCKICERSFARERISVHQKICLKSSKKIRKKFDPVVNRLAGTEAAQFYKEDREPPKKPKSNWKKKHDDLVNSIRAARMAKAHLDAGGKLADLPPPPPMDTSDLVQCPHCARRFSDAAAERHIPKCLTMQHNKPRHRPAAKPTVQQARKYYK